ncbi:hypothetical protein [Methylobacterium platani]|uniref:Uncharacterized protein n=2 Tax=Methylobacterium platani TaxID=427683 RepID=A0A179SGI2_9HYPH|nr:hypothetical protein [Methylobacterium platani]KMO10571.1 hypothetical protein SQ03_29875 [Methylobacterium platani JCM 14648]OAS25576.1 hypothetical protein A5481_09510 [Methylobacterium platani]
MLGALKDAVLILDEVKRLDTNIQKLTDRVDAIERRLTQDDQDRAVGAARDEALVAKIEAATRVAVVEASAKLSDRLTRLEIGLENGKSANGASLPPPARPDEPAHPTANSARPSAIQVTSSPTSPPCSAWSAPATRRMTRETARQGEEREGRPGRRKRAAEDHRGSPVVGDALTLSA